MHVFYWIISTPLVLFAISFAVSNRDSIDLALWPFPFEITVPVAALGLTGMLFGIFLGMLITWATGRRNRNRRLRMAERAADRHMQEYTKAQERRSHKSRQAAKEEDANQISQTPVIANRSLK